GKQGGRWAKEKQANGEIGVRASLLQGSRGSIPKARCSARGARRGGGGLMRRGRSSLVMHVAARQFQRCAVRHSCRPEGIGHQEDSSVQRAEPYLGDALNYSSLARWLSPRWRCPPAPGSDGWGWISIGPTARDDGFDQKPLGGFSQDCISRPAVAVADPLKTWAGTPPVWTWVTTAHYRLADRHDPRRLIRVCRDEGVFSMS
ncbi:hypothetical protein B0J15DRAFT_582502, partial [Fusarium solani]